MAQTSPKTNVSPWAQLAMLTHRILENLGLGPMPPDSLNPLEDAMPSALPQVQPPDTFRQALADNLSLAAHGQKAKLEIERPQRLRESLVLGVMLGLILATIATLILLLHSRPPSSETLTE